MRPTGVSVHCLAEIKQHEGVRTRPYRDVVALWTVGVGHLMYPQQAGLNQEGRKAYELRPEDDRTWTLDEVDAILKDDLKRFELGVLRLCPGSLTQGQMDGLVSFAFNVGLGALQRSTLRAKHNRQDYQGAADEFMKWTKAGGKVFPGLVKRRQAEQALYLSGGNHG